MKHDAEFRKLRLRQLNRAFTAYAKTRRIPRPKGGWLAAIREACGMPLSKVGARLSVTPQAIQKLQQSESLESITLKRLREVADALGCELVYAIVPKNGRLTDSIEEQNRKNATQRVIAVEHSMQMEDQSAGNVKDRIKEELSR